MTPVEIQERIHKADLSFNAHVISLAIVDMINEDPALTFADFETALRAIKSETYLIARPYRMKPIDLSVIWFKHRHDEEPEHFLWICLHGEDEQREELKRAGMTVPENLFALQMTCGVLAIKRSMHS